MSNFDRFIDPGRPGDRPPPSIQFGETDATPLTADHLVLKGLSGGSQPSPATCTLDVTSREQTGASGTGGCSRASWTREAR